MISYERSITQNATRTNHIETETYVSAFLFHRFSNAHTPSPSLKNSHRKTVSKKIEQKTKRERPKRAQNRSIGSATTA